MRMRTWRAVFTLGMFLAALTLLVSGVQAQATATTTATTMDDNQVTGVMVAAKAGTHDTLTVTWTFQHGMTADASVSDHDSAADIELSDPLYDDLGFIVYYTKGASATALNTAAEFADAMEMDVGVPTTPAPVSQNDRKTPVFDRSTTFKADLKKLDSGKSYVVNVLHYYTPLKAVVLADADGGIIPSAAVRKTNAADPPSDVRDVEVMPGDKKLMVSWRAPARPSGISTTVMIDRYVVRWRESQTTAELAGGWLMYPPATAAKTTKLTAMTYKITSLENDVMYDVQVRAINDAEGMGDWSPGDPVDGEGAVRATPTAGGATPTPALPLVGAFVLGAGVLAAGRRRLRRRAQRQLTR
jgi:hypothetical protein